MPGKRAKTSQTPSDTIWAAPFGGKRGGRRTASQGDAEMAIMNPMGAPPDVIFEDEWGIVPTEPARPHAEFGATWTPGVVGKSSDGTASSVQLPTVPTTDRPFFITKHPLRNAVVYMQNDARNHGLPGAALGQASYLGVFEIANGVESNAFPLISGPGGAGQCLKPSYAVPATAPAANGTGTILSTWPVHGPRLYPGHDNQVDLTTNTYGFWIDANGNNGAATTAALRTTQAMIGISLSWNPTAGANQGFELMQWDGVQFVPYNNITPGNPTGGLVQCQIGNGIAGQNGTWGFFNDASSSTKTACILSSGFYAIRYLGNLGTADAAQGLGGTCRILFVSGLGDVSAQLASPRIETVCNNMKRIKHVGSSILFHNSTPEINLAGIGTVVCARGGDWDPITDYWTATTSGTTITGLPAIAGTLYNIIAATDQARDFDPKLGLYAFCPMGSEDDIAWKKIWRFGTAGITGCNGFPIIPQEPWVIGCISIPQIIVGGVSSAVNFTCTLASYLNYELHGVGDWELELWPNISWKTVLALVDLFSQPDINYAMDNPYHWNDIKNFIRRTANVGRAILRFGPSVLRNPTVANVLDRIHPYARMIRERTADVLDAVNG